MKYDKEKMNAFNVAFIIPAYQPSDILPQIVIEMINRGINPLHIFVVDDGSSDDCRHYFDAIKQMGVQYLQHAVNLGKGQALKTAFNNVCVHLIEFQGVVTLDADGQHSVSDVLRVREEMYFNPGAIVIGARSFHDNVPLRSKLGNVITHHVFSFLSGIRLSDTQTGLRGIPISFLPSLLKIPSVKYDFELDMLINAVEMGIPIKEISIQTIYIDNNMLSHFHPLYDSIRVYFVFLRFLSTSLISFAGDYIIYVILLSLWKTVDPITLHIGLRIFTSFGNFLLNKYFVFKSKFSFAKEYISYIVTVVFILITTTSIIAFMTKSLEINPLVAKPIAELIGFFISFIIQKTIVFNKIKRIFFGE